MIFSEFLIILNKLNKSKGNQRKCKAIPFPDQFLKQKCTEVAQPKAAAKRGGDGRSSSDGRWDGSVCGRRARRNFQRWKSARTSRRRAGTSAKPVSKNMDFPIMSVADGGQASAGRPAPSRRKFSSRGEACASPLQQNDGLLRLARFPLPHSSTGEGGL